MFIMGKALAGLVSCGSLLQPALVLQLLGGGWNLGSLPSQWLRALALKGLPWGGRGKDGDRMERRWCLCESWQGGSKHPAGHLCFIPVPLGCSQKGLPPLLLAPHPLAELFWGMPYSHPRMPPAWQHYPGI